MCQLHLIMPLTRKINQKDTELMNTLLLLGGYYNKDAWGITNGSTTVTKTEQYNGSNLSNFTGSKFLVGHNRLGTQGITPQPIAKEGFTLSHNGILTEYSTTNNNSESDTLLMFNDLLPRLKNKDGAKGVCAALCRFFGKKYGAGSYSIFLTTKTGENTEVFYFKNANTSMEFGLFRDGEDYLIIASTEKENLKDMNAALMFGFEVSVNKYAKISTYTPENNTVYLIDPKEGIVPMRRFNNYGKAYTYQYPQPYNRDSDIITEHVNGITWRDLRDYE